MSDYREMVVGATVPAPDDFPPRGNHGWGVHMAVMLAVGQLIEENSEQPSWWWLAGFEVLDSAPAYDTSELEGPVLHFRAWVRLPADWRATHERVAEWN